ncbi:MAG: hypothetical protein L6R40_001387 [Gallowayella cf. fulva]|nr:MAG: hypothetical protein L6R40_001387 [Xanthomendoza cf. fulva]
MATKYIEVPITGKLRWETIWYHDNSTNPQGWQKDEYEKKIVRSLRISQFNESTRTRIEDTKQSSSVSATVGASYGPVSASVTGSHSASKEITDTYIGTIRQQKDVTIEVTTTEKHTYFVGPGGKGGLYQAYFSAPGIDVSLQQVQTLPAQPEAEEIQIILKMQELKFLSDIQVIYTDNVNDKPWDTIREVTGQNEDINSGFGGKYVWLKPIYTNQVSQAITDCRIRIQDDAWSGGTDLAKGAKGKFRYLQFNKDTNNDRKYTDVKLLRSAGKPLSLSEAKGFDFLTTDINKDRKGDFLYLAFQVREAFAVERITT